MNSEAFDVSYNNVVPLPFGKCIVDDIESQHFGRIKRVLRLDAKLLTSIEIVVPDNDILRSGETAPHLGIVDSVSYKLDIGRPFAMQCSGHTSYVSQSVVGDDGIINVGKSNSDPDVVGTGCFVNSVIGNLYI